MLKLKCLWRFLSCNSYRFVQVQFMWLMCGSFMWLKKVNFIRPYLRFCVICLDEMYSAFKFQMKEGIMSLRVKIKNWVTCTIINMDPMEFKPYCQWLWPLFARYSLDFLLQCILLAMFIILYSYTFKLVFLWETTYAKVKAPVFRIKQRDCST